MIILDTNVVSALMQATPEHRVIHWLDGVPQELLWISTITIFEITQGVELLPAGKRKEGLMQQFEKMLRHHYRNNIVEFDQEAALAAGELAADRKAVGHNIHSCDLQIAGIALTHGAAVATRNIKDFRHHGLELINPWDA